MKKFLAIVGFVAIFLAACQTPIASVPVSGTGDLISPDPKVAEVQKKSAGVCGFVPQAGAVIRLLSSGQYSGVIDLGTYMGEAICETIRRAQPAAVVPSGSASLEPRAVYSQLAATGATPRAIIPKAHARKERDPEKAKEKIERAPPKLDGVPLRGQFVR
jgi:hypothetical protein